MALEKHETIPIIVATETTTETVADGQTSHAVVITHLEVQPYNGEVVEEVWTSDSPASLSVIEIPLEMGRETVIRTPLMRTVEERLDEALEVNLAKLYHRDQLTKREIAAHYRVNEGSVSSWMKLFGIESRKTLTPEQQARRIEATRRTFQDQEKLPYIMEKVHSQSAREKRSRSIVEAHKAGKIKPGPEKIAAKQERVKQRKEELKRNFESGMSDEELSEIFGVTPETIQNWRHKYGLKREIGKRPSPNGQRRVLIEGFRETRYFDMLPPHYQEFCRRRFPTDGSEPASLSDIGSTRQAAHQMEVLITNKIRKICAEQGISFIDLMSSKDENSHA